jgi:CheY-like chemotaxis protein
VLERADSDESPMLPRLDAPIGAAAALLLVIDDEEGVRSVAARMLERSGYRVITAADGRAGVDLFRDHADSIAAVLLDLTMPHLDGEQTMRAIQAIRPDALVRVYAIASFSLRQHGTLRFLSVLFSPRGVKKALTKNVWDAYVLDR